MVLKPSRREYIAKRYGKLQSNHYGIETSPSGSKPTCGGKELQSNHYGIETVHFLQASIEFPGCNRTIMVLKHLRRCISGTLSRVLQSNHYGIETGASSIPSFLSLSLQSNHYGIETQAP